MDAPIIQCAVNAFSALENEVLVPIKAVCQAAQTALAAVKTSTQALVTSINISKIPMELKQQVLNGLLALAQDAVSIIPSGVSIGCPQLGSLNFTVTSALNDQLSSLADVSFDINQLNSAVVEANAKIAQIDAASQFLDSVIASINAVLAKPKT